MEAGLAWRPKYFTIYYRSTRSLQENMRIYQGNIREFSGINCPTFIAINQLTVKITRRSLSFGCICITSSTCIFLTRVFLPEMLKYQITRIFLMINRHWLTNLLTRLRMNTDFMGVSLQRWGVLNPTEKEKGWLTYVGHSSWSLKKCGQHAAQIR